MEVQKETAGSDAALLRPCPRHMSVTERLRKVVQELVDTEKSYVKVKHAHLEVCDQRWEINTQVINQCSVLGAVLQNVEVYLH